MDTIFTAIAQDWQSLSPEILVILTMLFIMLRELSPGREDNSIWNVYIALTGIGASALSVLVRWNTTISYPFSGSLIIGPVGDFFNLLFLLALGATLIISTDFYKKHLLFRTDYLIILLGALLGFMILAKANSLVTLFIGLELFSIALYILCGFYTVSADENPSASLMKRVGLSQESALKYLLLGAFASALLLYGLSLIYGTSGHTNFNAIARYADNAQENAHPLFLLGIGLFIVGFAFKLSLIPFHAWTPDVYEGAPTPVTSLMSFATKGAVFAVGINFLYGALSYQYDYWYPALSILAAITMLGGSVAALMQTNLKRMLAYSSISHAGYLILPVLTLTHLGNSALLFYLVIYLLMNMGAFAVIMAIEHDKENDNVHIRDLYGLSSRHPFLCFTLVIFMLSLAGIPPTGGFIAKLYLFMSAIDAGLYPLVLIAVLSSLISVFFYFRIIYAATRKTEESTIAPLPAHIALTSVALCFALALFYLGLNPDSLTAVTSQIVFFQES